jgi:hypothetical protein
MWAGSGQATTEVAMTAEAIHHISTTFSTYLTRPEHDALARRESSIRPAGFIVDSSPAHTLLFIDKGKEEFEK